MILSSGKDILKIFNFFLEQIGKVFDVMKQFEILPHITYYDFFIGITIIFILISIIRLGVKTQNSIRWLDNNYQWSQKKKLERLEGKGKHTRKYIEKNYEPKHGRR